MPSRQSTRRVASKEVQGDDSFVVLRRLTVDEARAVREAAKEEGFDDFETSLRVVASHVVDWNWVDDDGNPLPLPATDGTVIGQLTDDEVRFLRDTLSGGSEQQRKN